VSGTRGASRLVVRQLLGDLRDGDFAASNERINALLDQNTQRASEQLGYSDTWTTSFATLSAGNPDGTGASNSYQAVAILKRQSDGVILEKVSWDQLESLRQVATVSTGAPVKYAVREGSGQSFLFRVYPNPDATYVLDAFLQSIQGALTTDASVIGFGRSGVQAVELMTAADVVGSLSADMLSKLHLSVAAAGPFAARGKQALSAEDARQTSLRRTDSIARVVY
jgi:hypothetical protein